MGTEDTENSWLLRKPFIEVVLWCFGEYGTLLGDHASGLVETIILVLNKAGDKSHCLAIAVMALAKQWNSFPPCRDKIAATLKSYTDSNVLELQCRAVEFDKLLSTRVTNQVLEPMPPYDMEKDIIEDQETDEKGDDDDESTEDEDEG